jgi:hypothetical protein
MDFQSCSCVTIEILVSYSSSGAAHRPLKTPYSTIKRQPHQRSVWFDQMNSACASSGLSVPARNGSNGR